MVSNVAFNFNLRRYNVAGQYTVAGLLAMELPMTMTGLSGRFNFTIDKTAEGKLLVAGRDCHVTLSRFCH